MNTIKKIALAGFVGVTFLVYSINQRNENSAPVMSAKASTSASTTTTTGMSSSASTSMVAYKDGSYTGTAADAIYGYIQVKATVQGGKLTDVEFLQYPNDRRNSIEINTQAMPMLKQQAITVQTAQVDGVSGATDTSQAFIQSLGNALQQAKA
jgi:uncharacterized protein with FMN-binding domain